MDGDAERAAGMSDRNFVRYYSPTDWYFRLFGHGLSVQDHRELPALLSERYNGQHGMPKRRFIHIGPYCLKTLRPLPPKKR